MFRLSTLFSGIVLVTASLSFGQYGLNWYTIDGGGEASSGGPFAIRGTIGQADAGPADTAMTGASHAIRGGFWTFASSPVGAPAATALSATLRKAHGGMGERAIPVNLSGSIPNGGVTSEPRSGGVTELIIAFDVAPAAGANAVTLEQQACAPCPCHGTSDGFVPYSGASTIAANVQGNQLELTFTPGLENARIYRLTLGPQITSIPDQRIEFRGLVGDVNSDAAVNAVDRSLAVGVWTGTGFSASTDLDLNGTTNAVDRSMIVGAWTGLQSCAP